MDCSHLIASNSISYFLQDFGYDPCVFILLFGSLHYGLSIARETIVIFSLRWPTGKNFFILGKLGTLLYIEKLGRLGSFTQAQSFCTKRDMKIGKLSFTIAFREGCN